MTEPDQMRARFSAYKTAIETRDREALLACLTDDVVQVDPYPSAPNVGRDAVGAFFDQSWAMAEQIEMLVGTSVVVADRGVFPFTVRSTLAGGQQVELDVVDVVTFSDGGLISEITAYVDMTAMRLL